MIANCKNEHKNIIWNINKYDNQIRIKNNSSRKYYIKITILMKFKIWLKNSLRKKEKFMNI